MPRFIVEQIVPNAGRLSAVELKYIFQQYDGVTRRLGPDIQWLLSYVTADKLYSVFIASDEALIHEHSRQSGLPAGAVMVVNSIINPATGEGL